MSTTHDISSVRAGRLKTGVLNPGRFQSGVDRYAAKALTAIISSSPIAWTIPRAGLLANTIGSLHWRSCSRRADQPP